jgi:NtrC-family two-component system sensor histidine kinase KinB
MMENDNASPAASSSRISVSQRQARIYALTHELRSLTGQSQKKIARSLFSALVHATGVRSGRIFLRNDRGTPEYCLLLVKGRLNEYDEATSPSLQEQALAGWAYRERRGVLIADTTTDPRWSTWAQAPEATSAGSALAVPMLLAAQPIGAIALIAERPNYFVETDLGLVSNLADQTAIMIENSRLSIQLTQQQNLISALHQTAHTVSTSAGFYQTLHAVLQQLTQTVVARCGLILLLADKRLFPVTAIGFANIDSLLSQTFTATDLPAIFHVLDQGRLIITGNEEQLKGLGALVTPQPVQAWAIAPLLAQAETLGVLILADPGQQRSDDQNISTINAFADQLALTIANHRLAQEKERSLRKLAFLSETGQAITSTLNLEQILQLLLEQVRDLLQIDAVSIALRDERTGGLVFEAASGAGAAAVLGVRLKPGQGIAGWVAETGKPLLVKNADNDPRFYDGVDRKTGFRTRAVLCVPVVSKGHVVGVIEALNPDQAPFDRQTIELLKALSGLAASAIENARLFAQVRSAEKRYEGLFEGSANPIIITDLRGIIIEVNRNACALLGQTKDALTGVNLANLRSADDSLDFAGPLEHIKAGSETIFQTDISSGGQRTTIEIRGKRIQVKDTILIQWIGCNISDAIELEQTRADMVSMIIHDLRNPLANIMNSLDVMNDVINENDGSVSLDDLLNIANRSGQRMHQLIDSMLDISRLEAGHTILETRPTDLVPLLHDTIEFLKPQTDMRRINISARFAPDLPQVEIDADMISRVILNLLENANKFTHLDGSIQLTANVVGPDIEVTVSDNGPGIPPDQMPHIFEKFSRVHYKDGPEGTGLGLAFCKLAVETHGGRIWAESILGRGTTFRFTIPVKKPRDPS